MKFCALYENQPPKVRLSFSLPSLTRQSPAEQANINNIIRKYGYGVASQTTETPVFLDCSSLDYRESLNRILEVEERFMELPAVEREKFENDPELWLASVQAETTTPSPSLDITGRSDTNSELGVGGEIKNNEEKGE